MALAGLTEPDIRFKKRLLEEGGANAQKCLQCGTCSAICAVSPDRRPFPRKEMLWAQLGLSDRLLADPDIWLCHQCHDCSELCPGGARPGDVLAAVRRQAVERYSVPRFLCAWVNHARFLPVLLLIPAALLGLLALLGNGPVESDKIVFSYSSWFPHWLLISFFSFFALLALSAVFAGVARYWRAMKRADGETADDAQRKSLGASLAVALRSIVAHEDFAQCDAQRSRFLTHSGVFFGFIALFVVALWVMAAPYNPLIRDSFVYPFGFWSPWKMLANLGGLALVSGCVLMIRERIIDSEQTNTYFDWAFVVALLAVALTGFLAEGLHYARLEPHRHVAYFVHLMLVCLLLIYLPYSKFAHAVYRAAAMVYAERAGRDMAGHPVAEDPEPEEPE